MSGHTPGPWTQDKYGSVLDTQGNVLRVYGLALASGEEEYANARLISAAPDLLFALQRLVDNVDGGEFISITRIEEARAAIAKATGGAT